MTQDSFTIEGYTYYQQFRKCGKAGCKCNAGEPHGPYWYRRDLRTSKVSYVGKHLPEGVAGARFALDTQRADIQATRLKLAQQMRTLKRLQRGERLTIEEKGIIDALGFANCLVSPKSSAATQERDNLGRQRGHDVTQDGDASACALHADRRLVSSAELATTQDLLWSDNHD